MSDSLALLTGVATIIALLYSMAYTAEEEDSLAPFEVNALILLVGLAMLLLVRADDLLVIYLCVEFQSLALYVLAAGRSHSILSVEAGMKYFVLGAVASGIFVFGAALLYGTTGLTKLSDLQLFLQGMEAMPLDTGVVLALACVGIGLLFKVGAAPFHWWVGDVYEGAPLPITAFFGIGPKVAVFGLIVRLFTLDGLYLQAAWGILLPGCIALSFLVGAWGALTQTKIKRLFAYSSIGHTGWVLLGLATGTADGMGAALVYLVLYLAMSALVFALLLTLRTQAEGSRLTHLAQFTGLMRAEPLVAACMAVALLSMAGIPPLAGFASKATILFAALDAQMWWVAIVGLLTSVVSAFYYLRLISNMIFTESTEGPHTYGTSSWSLGMGASLLTFGLIGFGLYPQPLLTAALVLGLGG
jgi:NADH-quinone oxidoreductase subunit N